MSMVARLLDRLVWLYQKATEGRVSPCRYVPSCSTYAREAVEHHGAARGSWLAVRRVVRCAPWGGWGYDPVPGTVDAPAPDHADDSEATIDAPPSTPPDRSLRRTA